MKDLLPGICILSLIVAVICVAIAGWSDSTHCRIVVLPTGERVLLVTGSGGTAVAVLPPLPAVTTEWATP